MLNSIKEMVKEKQSLVEAASLIFNDANGLDIEDLIVLGEAGENESDTTELDEEDELSASVGDNADEEADLPEPDNSGDMMDEPVEDDDLPKPEPDEEEPVAGDDMMNEPVEGPDGINDLSSVEPAEDPTDDLLSVSIDLRSNTLNDTLPIPPANASDALPSEDNDSIMSQKVDSGFGGDDDGDSSDIVPPKEGELGDTPEEGSEEAEIPSEDSVGDGISEEPEEPEGDLSIESMITRLNESTQILQEFRGFRDVGNPERHIEDMERREKNLNDDSRLANSPLGRAAMDKFDKLMGDDKIDKSEYDKPLAKELKKECGDDLLSEKCDCDDDNCKDKKGKKSIDEECDKVVESIENLGNFDSSNDDYDLLTEEISLDGANNQQDPNTPPDANNGGGENSVTSAVRDKVNESQPDDNSGDGGDDMSQGLDDAIDNDTSSLDAGGSGNNTEEIFSKLSSLTKNLEDIKKDIIAKNQG